MSVSRDSKSVTFPINNKVCALNPKKRKLGLELIDPYLVISVDMENNTSCVKINVLSKKVSTWILFALSKHVLIYPNLNLIFQLVHLKHFRLVKLMMPQLNPMSHTSRVVCCCINLIFIN